MPTFNALSGPELKKFLLTKIEDALGKSDKFGNHLTHPWFRYTFDIGLVTYPTQAKDSIPKVVASGEGQEGDVDELLSTLELISDSQIVDTPDQARLETSQPIPTTAPGVGGVLVDKLVTPAPASFPGSKKGRQ